MQLPGSGTAPDLLLSSLSRHGPDAGPGPDYCSLRGLGLVLVQDSLQVSAGFVVQALLHRALREGQQVVLLALEQTLEKYKYCQKKMGLTLQQYIESGQLVVLGAADLGLTAPSLISDPLGTLKRLYRSIVQAMDRTCGTTQDGASSSTAGAVQGETGGSSSTRASPAAGPSSTQQQREQQQGPSGSPVGGGAMVLLDNVSLLSTLGCSSQDWRTFLHRCSALSRRVEQPCSCVLVAHGDVPEDAHWLLYLKHMAEVVVDVAPLGMRMADIDGTVTITRRSVGSTPQQSGRTPGLVQVDCGFEAVRSLYFRAGDMGVKWIPHLAVSDLM